MGRIVLITGGCRSGKSRHAQALTEQSCAKRVFVATCPVFDDEMRQRIEKHQQDREGRGWSTVEAAVDVAEAIQQTTEASVLVDCLTLWVNNLLYDAEKIDRDLSEGDVANCCRSLIDAARSISGDVFFVTNEVGMGIVPENRLARRFRDLAGRCNQVIADSSDEVVLMISGIAVPIKSQRD